MTKLGRSLKHLIGLSRNLQGRGVDLEVLDQGIDTRAAAGRMFCQVLGAIAEFEHALMSERTMDGLAAARARGRTGGQKPKLTLRQAHIAQEMYDETGARRQAPLHRGADRCRVRRHPPYHLPAPCMPDVNLGSLLAPVLHELAHIRERSRWSRVPLAGGM